ncbi:hypothetical protein KVR01_010270 [Diaporthe batatas]|uniref:uncharacterized protein n=1 Tax=Diaporthe batatas TaxID=748121 RepID=UPI001D04EA11|nr:uncharacterized protein KVR01_010270 [Diaporthe batatas]KAG8159633.1 hypothetical protein KVR01_010270 [Diaporthe batatas]
MGEDTCISPQLHNGNRETTVLTNDNDETNSEIRPLISLPNPGIDSATTPKKPLTILNGLALVIALQIGSGIFTLPAQVSQSVPTPGAGLLVWLLAGLLVWTGAASFIELGCRVPSNGGIQEYVRVAYGGGGQRSHGDTNDEEDTAVQDHAAVEGPHVDGECGPTPAAAVAARASGRDEVGPRGELAGFVFTWTWVVLAKPAANGAISTIAANYLSRPFLAGPSSSSEEGETGLSPLASRLTALACMCAITAINCLGATSGARAANVFLMLKLSALASIILVGLFALVTGWGADGVPASGTGWFGRPEGATEKPAWQLVGDFVTATFGAVFCYGGWETVRNQAHPPPPHTRRAAMSSREEEA